MSKKWVEANDFNVMLPVKITGKFWLFCGKYYEKLADKHDVLSLSWEELNGLSEHLANTIRDIEANPKRFFKD